MIYNPVLCLILSLVVLVFANQIVEWPNVSPSEINALNEFYNATGGPTWTWKNNSDSGPVWFYNSNPCYPSEWQGIQCDCTLKNCTVRALNLVKYNLTGYVPSLAELDGLVSLNLSANSLNAFPLSVLNLTRLIFLDIGFNVFEGTLPSGIGALEEIIALRLSGNNFTGTIPDSFRKLTKLRDLDLSANRLIGGFESVMYCEAMENLFLGYNRFNGSLPSSIKNLKNLKTLLLFSNIMSGTLIDELWTLHSLTQLRIDDNDFSGTIPEYIRNLTNLNVIDLSGNNFSSSFPSVLMEMTYGSLESIFINDGGLVGSLDTIFVNQSGSNLKILDLNWNYLTGTIPMIKLANLTTFGVAGNFITGPVPESLCNTNLNNLYLAYNLMNGTLPNCIGNLSLFDLLLSGNSFSGTLPAIVRMNATIGHTQFINDIESILSGVYSFNTNSSEGGYYAVDDNMFTGTIPESLCFGFYHSFFLSNNALHGTIPNCFFNMSDMLYFNVSHNAFSGTIPSKIASEQSLNLIAINHNAFTGPLPDLSGMYALVHYYVQHNRMTGPLPFHKKDSKGKHPASIAFVDVSNNELTGTIASEFFEVASSSLISFAAASNCFSGTISDDICGAKGLLFLDLDGMSTATNCRKPIFPRIKYLKSFTLRYQVVGGIPACLYSMPNLNTLHISGNGIEASFPKDLVLSESLEDLDLSYNKLTGTIPKIIQLKQWTNLDLSYNKLVGVLDEQANANSSELTLQVNRLSGWIPAGLRQMKKINILTGNRFACGAFRRGLPEYDYAYQNFQCGSNSFNQSVLLWCSFALIAGIAIIIAIFPHPKMADTVFMALHKYYVLLRFHWTTIVNDEAFASFAEFTHAIRVFVALIVGVILFVFLPVNTGISLSGAVHSQSYQYAWVVSACYGIRGFVPGLLLTLAYMGFIGLLYWIWTKMDEQREYFDYSILNKNYDSVYQTISLSLVVAANSIVMISVNAAYVLAVLYAPAYSIILATVSVAMFKLTWNEYAVRYLVKFSRRFYTHKLTSDSPSFMEVRSAQEMPFLAYMALFNCLVAPFLVSAVIDPNCFREMFVRPHPVSSTFPNYDCSIFEVQMGKCGKSSANGATIVVTYDPPFIYSYQCTSSIMTNYAPVYVIMYLVTIFFRPLFMWLLVYAYKYLGRETYLYYWTSYFVSSILKPANLEDLLMNRVIFYKERFILRYISSTSVLLTFGVLFPPLAVVICGSFFTEQLMFGVLMGRYLNNVVDPITRGLFKEILLVNSENCWGLYLNPLARLVAPFAAVFFALIVFDIYGDVVGWRKAMWMPAMIVAMPCLLYVLRKLQLSRSTRTTRLKSGASEKPLSVRDSEGRKSRTRSGSRRSSGGRTRSQVLQSIDKANSPPVFDVELVDVIVDNPLSCETAVHERKMSDVEAVELGKGIYLISTVSTVSWSTTK